MYLKVHNDLWIRRIKSNWDLIQFLITRENKRRKETICTVNKMEIKWIQTGVSTNWYNNDTSGERPEVSLFIAPIDIITSTGTNMNEGAKTIIPSKKLDVIHTFLVILMLGISVHARQGGFNFLNLDWALLERERERERKRESSNLMVGSL